MKIDIDELLRDAPSGKCHVTYWAPTIRVLLVEALVARELEATLASISLHPSNKVALDTAGPEMWVKAHQQHALTALEAAAKIRNTYNVEKDLIDCPDGCGGCSCHVNPPCPHCSEGHDQEREE